MKQVPVAWIEEDGMVKFDVKWASQMQGKEPIPLYTEPQTKPLSDEEIKEVWFSLERELNTTIKYGLKLARAIEERHGIK